MLINNGLQIFRSYTLDTMIKVQKVVIPASINISHPLVIPVMTLPVPHSEKTSVDFVESTTAGYLFPNSTRCRRVFSRHFHLILQKLLCNFNRFLATHQKVHIHQQDQVQGKKKSDF